MSEMTPEQSNEIQFKDFVRKFSYIGYARTAEIVREVFGVMPSACRNQCAYCGFQFHPPNIHVGLAEMRKHVVSCEKHPIRQFEILLDAQGCFTGDCPHDNVNQCLLAVRRSLTELVEDFKSGRDPQDVDGRRGARK